MEISQLENIHKKTLKEVFKSIEEAKELCK